MSTVDLNPEKFTTGPGSVLNQCAYCDHRATVGDAQVCRAFPSRIPDAILDNSFDHRRPWMDRATNEPGDTGLDGEGSITFKARPGVPREVLQALYQVLDATHRP